MINYFCFTLSSSCLSLLLVCYISDTDTSLLTHSRTLYPLTCGNHSIFSHSLSSANWRWYINRFACMAPYHNQSKWESLCSEGHGNSFRIEKSFGTWWKEKSFQNMMITFLSIQCVTVTRRARVAVTHEQDNEVFFWTFHPGWGSEILLDCTNLEVRHV